MPHSRKDRVVSPLPVVEKAEGRKFICTMPFSWGTGPTVKQAFIQALRNYRVGSPYSGQRARAGQEVQACFYDAPKCAYVNDMGGLNWNIKEAEAQGGKPKALHEGVLTVKAIPFQRAILD